MKSTALSLKDRRCSCGNSFLPLFFSPHQPCPTCFSRPSPAWQWVASCFSSPTCRCAEKHHSRDSRHSTFIQMPSGRNRHCLAHCRCYGSLGCLTFSSFFLREFPWSPCFTNRLIKDSLLHLQHSSFLLQVGNLFGSHRSTIITLYNGAFDSSSALLLIIKVRSILPPWAKLVRSCRSGSVPPFASPGSSCTSPASPSAHPSSFCPPAASFTCSGPSSCCPGSSSPIRCPMATHTGATSEQTAHGKSPGCKGAGVQLTVWPLAFTRTTCGQSQTQRSEKRAEKSSTENKPEETPFSTGVPQTQGVYACVSLWRLASKVRKEIETTSIKLH